MERRWLAWLAGGIVALAYYVCMWFWPQFAHAHSWYPWACCGDQDCHPVVCENLTEQSDGRWIYKPTGNVFAPEQVQPSQDGDCHVCLGVGDGRSLCAFVQANS